MKALQGMTPELEERIRLRALEIWRAEGCPEGRAREHWEMAERELGGERGREVGGDQPTDQAASEDNPPPIGAGRPFS
jgi:hypothetical protein